MAFNNSGSGFNWGSSSNNNNNNNTNNNNTSWNFNWGSSSNNNNNNTSFSWNNTNNNNNNDNNDNNDNNQWNFNICSGLAPLPDGADCNYSRNKMDEKEICVPNVRDRELLVYGYGRKQISKIIPVDILALCFKMFGLNGFSFNIKPQYLQKTYFYQTKTFYCKDMEFQIIIKRKEKKSSGWNFGYDENNVYFHIIFTDKLSQHKPQKTAKIAALCTIYCPALNKTFQSVVDSSFHILKGNESMIEMAHGSSFDVNDLKVEQVEFNANLEILHIDILNTTENKLRVYHPNTKLMKKVDYKWIINPNISPSTKTYISPAFGNGHWNLMYSLSDKWSHKKYELRLQLLSLPPNISSINVLWRTTIEYKGKCYTTAKTTEFKLNSYEAHTCFYWNDNAFPPSLDTDTDNIISFTIFLEISQAQKQDYDAVVRNSHIKNGQSFYWNWGPDTDSGWSTNTISNDQLYLNGIIDGNNDDNNNNDNRLLLQKVISNVKQNDDVTSNVTTNNSGWAWNTSAHQTRGILYIESGKTESDPSNANIDNYHDNEHDDDDDYDDGKDGDIKDGEEKEEKEEESRSIDRDRGLIEKEQNIKRISFDFGVKKTNEDQAKNKEINEIESGLVHVLNKYEWIEKSLRKIESKYCIKILTSFKNHCVTDERLIDLDSSDWKELIPQIGIRNEMEKSFKKEWTQNQLSFVKDDEL